MSLPGPFSPETLADPYGYELRNTAPVREVPPRLTGLTGSVGRLWRELSGDIELPAAGMDRPRQGRGGERREGDERGPP